MSLFALPAGGLLLCREGEGECLFGGGEPLRLGGGDLEVLRLGAGEGDALRFGGGDADPLRLGGGEGE